MKERIYYFDTYRFIAAMIIFMTHFINAFSPESFHYFHVLPLSIVMDGVSGKLGVAMLCVILGYFAYRKGASSDTSLVILTVQRYVYFVVMALFYHVICFTLNYFLRGDNGGFPMLLQYIKESFTLSQAHNSLFWSLLPMLIGSAVCYILGRLHAKAEVIILMLAVMYLLFHAWVLVCALGCLLAVWEKDPVVTKIMSHRWVRIVLFLVTFCLIRSGGDESFMIYLMDGLFCFALVLITMNQKTLQKIMNARCWRVVNKSYFGLYVLHPVFYEKFGQMFLESKLLLWMPFKLRFVFVFLLGSAIVIALSFPLESAVKFVCVRINRLINAVADRARKTVSAYAGN